jgi:hypothetical protein
MPGFHAHHAKKRCVNVAMKVIAMSKPRTDSPAATAAYGSSGWLRIALDAALLLLYAASAGAGKVARNVPL